MDDAMSDGTPAPAPSAEPQLDDMFADDEDTVMQPPAESAAPSASVSVAAVDSAAPTASASRQASRSVSRAPNEATGTASASLRSSASAADGEQPNPLEYEEEDYEGPNQIKITAALELPKIPVLDSSDKQQWILRLPEAVHVQSYPFHPDVYRSQMTEAQEAEDAQANTIKEKQALALKRMNEVSNTVRWRWQNGTGGVPARRSNARIVRWSDGSSSLQIGSEFWEVDNSSAQHRGAPFGGLASTDDKAANGTKSKPKGVSLLLANDRLNQVAVGQALVAGELSLVPSGPDAIKRQQRVQLAIDGTVRKAGIKTWDDAGGEDPELAQQERERERRKKRSAPRPLPVWNPRASSGRSGGAGSGRPRASGGGGGGGSRRTRQSSFDSEDMDDEDPIGSSRGGGGGGYGTGYQADGFVVSDEEDDIDSRRPAKSKKGRSARDYSDEDDDDEAPLDDEEEEEDEDAPGEPDNELEAADAAAEEAERRRKREKREKAAANSREAKSSPQKASSAMDVDSDEDLQRAPPKAKRVLQIEEEEDSD